MSLHDRPPIFVPSRAALAFVERCDVVASQLGLSREGLSRKLIGRPESLDQIASGAWRASLADLDRFYLELDTFTAANGGDRYADQPLAQRLLAGLEARGHVYFGLKPEVAVFHLVDQLIERVMAFEGDDPPRPSRPHLRVVQ